MCFAFRAAFFRLATLTPGPFGNEQRHRLR